ncbi:nucleotidyl transferase AbiEii/AbiGii toxin family protein [Vibrio fluvialis]
MPDYKIEHHKIIESALSNFNAVFFCQNNIIFGGGTRIALELDEFRESVDIDFLCPNKTSYRAVRQEVTNVELGALVKDEFEYVREIRADRDAVRTVIKVSDTAIKLEFVSFDNYELTYEFDPSKFPVPVLSQESCFYTKLLANADRKLEPPYKDIFDILAMYKAWGSIPTRAIELAENHYGERTVVPSLINALEEIIKSPERYVKAATIVKMNPDWVDSIVYEQPPTLLKEMKHFLGNRVKTA